MNETVKRNEDMTNALEQYFNTLRDEVLVSSDALANYVNVKKQTIHNYKDTGVLTVSKRDSSGVFYFNLRESIGKAIFQSRDSLREYRMYNEVNIVCFTHSDEDLGRCMETIKSRYTDADIITSIDSFCFGVSDSFVPAFEDVKKAADLGASNICAEKLGSLQADIEKKTLTVRKELEDKYIGILKEFLVILENTDIDKLSLDTETAKQFITELAKTKFNMQCANERAVEQRMRERQALSIVNRYKYSGSDEIPSQYKAVFTNAYRKAVGEQVYKNLADVMKDEYVVVNECRLADDGTDFKRVYDMLADLKSARRVVILGYASLPEALRPLVDSYELEVPKKNKSKSKGTPMYEVSVV